MSIRAMRSARRRTSTYIQHVRQARAQNDYTVPRLKETRWLDHKGRMKLTFCSAEGAEYARKWVKRDKGVAKYMV